MPPDRTDVDEELAELSTPPAATPPGVGAGRTQLELVRDVLPDATRLGVDLKSSPNTLRPAAVVVLLEPLEPEVDEPEPPPDDDEPVEPPPLLEEPDDDEPLVVRGTAWPARAGTAKPTATRKVSARIDLVMACSLIGTSETYAS